MCVRVRVREKENVRMRPVSAPSAVLFAPQAAPFILVGSGELRLCIHTSESVHVFLFLSTPLPLPLPPPLLHKLTECQWRAIPPSLPHTHLRALSRFRFRSPPQIHPTTKVHVPRDALRLHLICLSPADSLYPSPSPSPPNTYRVPMARARSSLVRQESLAPLCVHVCGSVCEYMSV